nr:immunoglobulin heavy chain junction region [Mus musculus]
CARNYGSSWGYFDVW